MTVKCTDNSTGNPTRFMYDFGDGVNVSGPDPVHTYRYPGTFSITLTITKYNSATNSVIGTSTTKKNVVTVSKVPFVMPVAKFTASPTIGTAPLTVQFTDQSSGDPTRYNYDFGDGVNMTGQNPRHTYRYPGVYNVTLTVLKNDLSTGSIVSNASVQKDLVRVNRK
jgi:PKD repeat protein